MGRGQAEVREGVFSRSVKRPPAEERAGAAGTTRGRWAAAPVPSHGPRHVGWKALPRGQRFRVQEGREQPSPAGLV